MPDRSLPATATRVPAPRCRTSGAGQPAPVCRGPISYRHPDGRHRQRHARDQSGAYSFEAANVRHEHEWKIWRDVKLPEGKVIPLGAVSHSTNVVEHPELVADRIVRYAEAVGRENVVASTGCGLGGRVHPQIAWAKLGAMARGAELATKRLCG